jgi:hypothetical protein
VKDGDVGFSDPVAEQHHGLVPVVTAGCPLRVRDRVNEMIRCSRDLFMM